ncbi:MAG: hypothetical protein KJI69_00665 [Patescibacteria group bacterium]|nr:hypothetical protein [Patescibacteria group bacterium]
MKDEKDEATVTFVEEILEDGRQSDQQVRAMFYDVTKGMNQATQKAAMDLLSKHRPLVARQIERELQSV